jgi:hypothetical protein
MNSDERRQAIELEIRNFGAAAARKDYVGVAGFLTSVEGQPSGFRPAT